MSLEELRDKIESKDVVLGVIGLGYVGLPVACMFADTGFRVIGIERKTDRVKLINEGQSPIEGREPGLAELLKKVVAEERFRASISYEDLQVADVTLIAVETPIDENHVPHYEALEDSLCSLGSVLKKGALVIVESTVAPGTMDGLVRPLLEEKTGWQVNDGLFLGHCPERVMPGKLLSNLRNVHRVCGGNTAETSEVMISLYRTIVDADLDATDCTTAELVKTAENAYRDINIAFANELALICEAVGGNVWKVRELVNKSPGRNVLLPGAGVGGHCIPKDPWLLAHGAHGSNIPVRLIPAARAVNDSMPQHMVELIVEALREAGVDIAGSKVLLLGYAYLENSDDTRNSPSEVLGQYLQELGIEVVIHDPYVSKYQGDLQNMAEACNAAVVMVRHDEYGEIDLENLISWLSSPVVIDGRNLFGKDRYKRANGIFRIVGG